MGMGMEKERAIGDVLGGINYSFVLWRWMGDVRIAKFRAARAPVVEAT